MVNRWLFRAKPQGPKAKRLALVAEDLMKGMTRARMQGLSGKKVVNLPAYGGLSVSLSSKPEFRLEASCIRRAAAESQKEGFACGEIPGTPAEPAAFGKLMRQFSQLTCGKLCDNSE